MEFTIQEEEGGGQAGDKRIQVGADPPLEEGCRGETVSTAPT
jgi:hypothetical protein